MRTSGVFETTCYTVSVKTVKEVHHFVPFSDVHWGHSQFAKKEWEKFKRWGEEHPFAHFVGNGDYWDWCNATGRAAIRGAMNEEQREILDQMAQELVEQMAGELSFMKGRLIGLGDGNHDWEFQDGSNATMRLAKKLGCKYLGVSAVANITFDYQGRRTSFQYYQHHGKGGATATVGGSYNAVERMHRHTEGVQIFCMGHNHDKGIIPGKPRLSYEVDIKNGGLIPRSRTPFYVRSGGFTKAYEPGKRSYVVDAAMGPTGIGTPYFNIRLSGSTKQPFQVHLEAVSPA